MTVIIVFHYTVRVRKKSTTSLDIKDEWIFVAAFLFGFGLENILLFLLAATVATAAVSTERKVDHRVALKYINKGKINRSFINEIHFCGIINVLQNFK